MGYTVNDLIKELQSLTDEQKKLPVFAYNIEGEQVLNINSIDDTITDRIDINLAY